MKKLQNSVLLILVVLTAITVALYWQTYRFEFTLDDIMVISENRFVTQGIKGIPEILSGDSMTGFMGNQPRLLEGGRYRPLSLVLFAAAFEIFGRNPSGYHVLNLLLYLLTGILLFFLLKELFRTRDHNLHPLLPGLAVLLFMVHPVHTEVVCNIKGADEILALLLATGGWLSALRWAGTPGIWPAVTSCVLFFLSFMAKESTLPLVAAVPLSLVFFRKMTFRRAITFMLFLVIPAVIYLLIRYKALGFLISGEITHTGIMNDPYSGAGLLQKYATILLTLLIYLKLMFIPWPLTHDYYPWHIPLQSPGNPAPWAAFITLIFLGYLIYRHRKSYPSWSFAIFYFFITLSIVSNVFINVGTLMNERFLFIPSVSLSILAIWFIQKFSIKAQVMLRVIAWGIPALMVAFFAFLSFNRIPDWRNNKTLDLTDVKISRNSARANLFAGVSIWNDILNEKNDSVKLEMIREAVKFNDRALTIYPEYADALKMKTGYASELWKMNKDLPALLKEFEEAVAVRPVPFVEEFVDWLLPRADKTLLVPFLYKVGYEHFAKKQNNFPEALKYLRKGYRLDGNDAGILFGLCVISGLSGNHEDAIVFGNRYMTLYGKNEEIQQYVNRSAGQLSLKNKLRDNVK